MASQITSLTIVTSTPKLHITGLLRGIRRWQVNSPHKWPVTRKIIPFHDVIMSTRYRGLSIWCHLSSINPSHKSQNASVPYTTMQHFVTEIRTCVHISVTKWCIVGYLSDAFWDLWDGSIWISHKKRNHKMSYKASKPLDWMIKLRCPFGVTTWVGMSNYILKRWWGIVIHPCHNLS